MDVKALTKYARISPLKARQVAMEIQGLPVSTALNILNFTPKKAAHLFSKTLKSAVANAEHNFDLSVDNLVVKVAVANTGPVQKRIKPMARGSANPIRKPTSHILVVVSDDKAAE
jgi:large subunit ribosomal protein L22